MAAISYSINRDVHDVKKEETDGVITAIHDNAEKFDPKTEAVFKYIQIFTAICDSFAHGANDVANAMGTSVGARALTLKQAIIIAAIFEFAGAYLAGGEVTSTIRKGIIDPSVLSDSPELLVFGMLSALLAAATWLLIASIGGWPVSTTHSIVGGIVGFAAVGILEGTLGRYPVSARRVHAEAYVPYQGA